MKRIVLYKRIFLVLLTAFVWIGKSNAQESLRINTIFEKYGKQKGSTMVVLSKQALENYKLDKYRSLTRRYAEPFSNDVQQSLEADKKMARKIKEVISSGIISSGYYQLPFDNNRLNRYILFKISDEGIATLIYMEGGLESEELINNIFIKKK